MCCIVALIAILYQKLVNPHDYEPLQTDEYDVISQQIEQEISDELHDERRVEQEIDDGRLNELQHERHSDQRIESPTDWYLL